MVVSLLKGQMGGAIKKSIKRGTQVHIIIN